MKTNLIPSVLALGTVVFMTNAFAADPYVDSWFTANSGKYARIYTTDANKTAGTSVTTWSNGTQTQSYTYANLLQEIPDLQSIGIGNFRISPHTADMIAIAKIFRAVQQGKMDTTEGLANLSDLIKNVEFSNGFYHSLSGKYWKPAALSE